MVVGIDCIKLMITTLNKAINIHTTISITFFIKLFHSFHCHVWMIYVIQLYNIIVTDKVIVNISKNLVTFTIKDGDFFHQIAIVDHFMILFHTLFTSSPKLIIVSWSLPLTGTKSCHNKSFAA